eukprot:1159640-Pelagomonas_calceolata.AAC.3
MKACHTQTPAAAVRTQLQTHPSLNHTSLNHPNAWLASMPPSLLVVGTHSQRRASVLQWNPEVATQLVVASDDDRSPTLQMWDLRNSVSPLKEFVGHSKASGGREGVEGGQGCVQVAHPANVKPLQKGVPFEGFCGAFQGKWRQGGYARGGAVVCRDTGGCPLRQWRSGTVVCIGRAEGTVCLGRNQGQLLKPSWSRLAWDRLTEPVICMTHLIVTILLSLHIPHPSILETGCLCVQICMQGVLGMAWSPHDPSLLLSCAKDNRTICWDVHSTDMLCELPSHPGAWNFDVQARVVCLSTTQ